MGMEKRIVLVCGSRKPAPGKNNRSAARQLLAAALKGIRDAGGNAELIDLRDLDLPFFDGRSVDEYGCADLERLRDALASATSIVLSVPAYWGGPSGVIKNCLDLLGGAAYDLPQDERSNVFSGKVVRLLVVGADDLSAHNGLTSIQLSLSALGAWVAPHAIVVGDLRQVRNIAALVQHITDWGATAWHEGLRPSPPLSAVR